ncbi:MULTISPECIES: hypothetical protein [unclassified Microbacterium]|uniref:hypothetical protein n=1 Tax=unclassified Microbacterium TaxID=2609290 RepID=UPI00261EC1F5|nr:hypothetical protein [Microbacterium sp.]
MSTTGEKASGSAATAPDSTVTVDSAPRASHRSRGDARRAVAGDLVILSAIGALLIAAFIAAGATLYAQFYGPSAFVVRYANLLADGNATQALAVPGVAVSSADLEAAGLPADASEDFLRSSALGDLSDIRVVSETNTGDTIAVTLAYSAGGHEASTTFSVEQDGMNGIFPRWEFAQSPIAVMDLTVNGSSQFAVNGFSVDKRQVSPDGAAADLSAPIPLLVFSPGIYSVTVDTPTATSPGVAMLSDVPFTSVPVTVTATASDEFVALVQEKVDAFLDECTQQEVLQPTACPFGFDLTDRIVTLPTWSIVQDPTVSLVADGAGWRIAESAAMAHIELRSRSLFDGSVSDVSVDVPFVVTGTIDILPDGTASILLG